MKNKNKELLGKTIREDVVDSKKKMIVAGGTVVTPEVLAKLSGTSKNIQIVPYVSDESNICPRTWMRNSHRSGQCPSR